jgi:hypothetical protein
MALLDKSSAESTILGQKHSWVAQPSDLQSGLAAAGSHPGNSQIVGPKAALIATQSHARVNGIANGALRTLRSWLEDAQDRLAFQDPRAHGHYGVVVSAWCILLFFVLWTWPKWIHFLRSAQ